jgi:hypothetical protein
MYDRALLRMKLPLFLRPPLCPDLALQLHL